jgi:hypothetical protein
VYSPSSQRCKQSGSGRASSFAEPSFRTGCSRAWQLAMSFLTVVLCCRVLRCRPAGGRWGGLRAAQHMWRMWPAHTWQCSSTCRGCRCGGCSSCCQGDGLGVWLRAKQRGGNSGSGSADTQRQHAAVAIGRTAGRAAAVGAASSNGHCCVRRACVRGQAALCGHAVLSEKWQQ